MGTTSIQLPLIFVAALVCAATAPILVARQEPGIQPGFGPVISGRVVDPQQLLHPEEAALMLGWHEGHGSFSRRPIPIAADGSFMTPGLRSGRYVFEIVRTPHSVTKPATVVGFQIVRVERANVSGVIVEVRRDTALTGTFRMESDNRNAEWPPHIVVNAFLALDGLPMFNGTVAEGAMGGRFVLRNAFGPRVLRCGYTLAPGARWSPSRVLLDGVDITNVPTDFSQRENGELEISFTQHPARIAGTVVDTQGQPVRAPWVVMNAANRALWQHWATTSHVVQSNTMGQFSVSVLPGAYRVRGVPLTRFHSSIAARHGILNNPSDGVTVTVKDREVKTVQVPLQER